MCTTVISPSSPGLLMGHNYDFAYGHGLLVANRRGLRKTSLHDQPSQAVEWTSRFGSLTLNQFAAELPVSGLNEAGLALALMWHEEGQFPSPDGGPSLNELQWIQYQLDTRGSVAEVLDHLGDIRIQPEIFSLHYALADAAGEVALIEFLDGRPQVVRNPEVAVLANRSHEPSLAHAVQMEGTSAPSRLHMEDSLDRYFLARRLAARLQPSRATASDLFDLLHAVRLQPSFRSIGDWILRRTPPTFTQWTSVFDVATRVIHIRSRGARSVSSFALGGLDYDGDHEPMAADIPHPGNGGGPIEFRPFTVEDNRRLVEASFRPVADRFPTELRQALAQYPWTFDGPDSSAASWPRIV